ncbi:tetratricopeptide repeat protein [Floridanema aerugineum]|uniref:Tetratricopeptide repeat protein n=1 Tax=Floridaenema aerugineum BLCC-F46 TaxID=3153654 RepID=A0ABV4X5S1_9CYAN
MIQQKRIRRSYFLSENGWNKFQDALKKKFDGKCSNERLAELSGLSTDTVSQIKRRKKRVDESSIEALFSALGLTLEESDLSVNVQVSPPTLDPNFVGREGAIAHLKNLIEQGAKAIVIHGKGGIGKTTLAWQFLHTQGFDKILDLRMAKETQNITSAESVIEEWLRRYFDEEPGREFGVTLDRLRQQLRNPKQRIGILIDNLEPALDEKGRCIEAHRKYVELFTALADPAVQSVTLITSRERLREAAVTVENYRLEGLDIAAWEKFFNSRKIPIDTEVLNAMHQAYGGNAKAMQIFPGAIKEYNNSLAAYWQANKDDLLIERELEGLVVSQFDRLQQLDSSAYKLLCRLGCYRYQDVPKVPENDSEKGLSCLLWDVPVSQRKRVINSLKDRSLVDFCNREYWLHPVIRAEAVKRLRESEDWETANRKAAEFWTESVKTVETVEDALQALEEYYHYLAINNFEKAGSVIIENKDINQTEDYLIDSLTVASLGSSFIRLGIYRPMLLAISQVIEKVEDKYCLAKLYNLMGDLVWLNGNIKKAIDYHEKSGCIAKAYLETIDQKDSNIINNCKILSIVYLFNRGICKGEIGELHQAIEDIEQANLIAKENNLHGYQIRAWSKLASLYSSLGLNLYSKINYRKKVEELVELVNQEISTKSLGIRSQGYRLFHLGIAYKSLGKFVFSMETYQKAIKYAEQINFIQLKGIALFGIAELYREQGDFTTALSHHTESIELLEKIGAKCDLAEAYYQLALTYQKMGDTEKSQPKFQQAIRLFTEMEAPKQVEKVRQAMENG